MPVEPTNNVAERALLHYVIDRRVTQRTHGETGKRWCERAGTAIMTCRKQGRSVFKFFREAMPAYVLLLQNP